ncbi:hypothetical protein M436DRAFT_59620 [Aureobasidium namibiae CBS 147.97]|uniref:Uncharacterized protein n=1 Tax=Aureobasidium namibiae CBS 147.97 TaxID=1043004 RepID=A0A074X1N6_9PEZI
MCSFFHDKHTEEYYNYCNVYREIQSSYTMAGQKDSFFASRWNRDCRHLEIKGVKSGWLMQVCSVRPFCPLRRTRGRRSNSGRHIHSLLGIQDPCTRLHTLPATLLIAKWTCSRAVDCGCFLLFPALCSVVCRERTSSTLGRVAKQSNVKQTMDSCIAHNIATEMEGTPLCIMWFGA